MKPPKRHTKQPHHAAPPAAQRSRSVHKASSGSAAHHARTERAQTLMRHAVKKPAVHASAAPVAAAPAINFQVPQPAVPDEALKTRFNRAKRVHKSQLISRFGAPIPNVVRRTEPMPVKPEPKHRAPHPAAKPAAMPPRSAPAKAAQPHHNPFERALHQATSHQQHRPKAKKQKLHHKVARKLKVHPKVVSTGAAVALLLLIGSFFAYQNAPNLTMRLAAARAGFGATMPGYQPSGFALQGPIKYSPGEVILTFRSQTDGRQFQVIQRSSNWNSDTLLDNFVASTNQPYQTYQEKGKTIYIYSGSNATWVDGGIWYQVESKAGLSSDQLIRLAASL